MAKIIKKKFLEVNLPLVNEKYETLAGSVQELDGRVIKMDMTRKLRGKSVNVDFKIKVENNIAEGHPKKLVLLPYFIKHMIHPGTDYAEDSFKAETKESEVIIKPFLITRRRVSRAVLRTLRNSAKNWLTDYAKSKTDYEMFDDMLSNQLQKQLSLRLKKVYPLGICEIRVFEIKKALKNAPIKEEKKFEAEVEKLEEKIEKVEEKIEKAEEKKEEIIEEKAEEEIKKTKKRASKKKEA